MRLSTVLAGKSFDFKSIKEVLAKSNEAKSGDQLAGIAATSDLERVAAKAVLSRLLVRDLRENPVVSYEDDEVTRINQDSIVPEVYELTPRTWPHHTITAAIAMISSTVTILI